jgi:hypothetical protein
MGSLLRVTPFSYLSSDKEKGLEILLCFATSFLFHLKQEKKVPSDPVTNCCLLRPTKKGDCIQHTHKRGKIAPSLLLHQTDLFFSRREREKQANISTRGHFFHPSSLTDGSFLVSGEIRHSSLNVGNRPSAPPFTFAFR